MWDLLARKGNEDPLVLLGQKVLEDIRVKLATGERLVLNLGARAVSLTKVFV